MRPAAGMLPWTPDDDYPEDAQEEDEVENSRTTCRAKNKAKCPTHGTGVRHHQAGHQRATRGDTRGNTDHPKQIQANDKLGEVERKLTDDIDQMRRGHNVATGYDMGKGKELHLMPGDKAHWGGVHGDRKEEHPIPISSQELAKTITRGERSKNIKKDDNPKMKRNTFKIEGENGVQMIIAPAEQPSVKPGEKIKPMKENKPVVGKIWWKKK